MGFPDNSFGVNGTTITNFSPGGEQINSMVLQTDGKIVVAGKSNDQFLPQGYISVARYQTNGRLDSTFGENGNVITAIGSMSSVANKVLIQEDKKIIITGTNFDFTGDVPSSDFAVVRYTKDGVLNDHFGDNGIVLTDFGGIDNAYDALLQPDGKIIVVGKTSSFNFAIVRYNGDPTPSPRFAKLKKWLHHHGITWEDKPDNKINYYSVQRSANGSAFNEIARILHFGNTTSYHFEDPAPLNGDNYYRLSAVSADGSSVTSNIVLVENNIAAATIKIYPNPAKNNLIIEGLASTGNTKLRITDLYGNMLFKATATGNTHTCNIASLKTGTYIMAIQTGNEIITRKFVKE